MNNDQIKRADQIALLETSLEFTETGKWKGMFSYPNCGWDLVQQGLVTADKRITTSGRAILWLLEKGPDPTASKAAINFELDFKSAEDTK